MQNHPTTKSACSIEGCTAPVNARRLCGNHYTDWKRSGRPPVFYGVDTSLMRPLATGRQCAVDGCTTAVHCKNLCVTHHSRWRGFGYPEQTPELLERLLTRVNPPIRVPCSIEGCTSSAGEKSELCKRHYNAWYFQTHPERCGIKARANRTTTKRVGTSWYEGLTEHICVQCGESVKIEDLASFDWTMKDGTISVYRTKKCGKCLYKTLRKSKYGDQPPVRCGVCDVILPDRTRKYCVKCSRKRRNKQRKSFTTNRYGKRGGFKKKALEMRGGKCERCGFESAIQDVYDFHHLVPADKKAVVSGCGSFNTWPAFWAECQKCALLCANCHRITHWEARQQQPK